MWLINMSILKKNKYKFIFLNPRRNEKVKFSLNLEKIALFTKKSSLPQSGPPGQSPGESPRQSLGRGKNDKKIQIQTSGKNKISQKGKRYPF